MTFRDWTVFFILCVCFQGSFGQKSIHAPLVISPPQIDGVISVGEWKEADSTKSFTQLEPNKGEQASENTNVYISFDTQFLYIGFICYQSEAIVGNVQTRDKLQKSDDAVMLVLDTYNDNRSGYGFIVNPIGTQTEFRITDDGRNKNYEWDMEWQSATSEFPGGWSAELAIPFKDLKYKASKNQWGVNFGRIIRHNSETDWWTKDMSDDFRVSQGGALLGIRPPSGVDKILITPYTTLRYNSNIQSVGDKKMKFDAGGDIRYNITPNLNLNATINPDFASIEGDRQQVDLSGWEISFPEKRLFFQEGNEMFDTRYRLFYSRRIGDINYGGKFTGKAGPFSMNVMSVRSVENISTGEPPAFFNVARVKGDILKSSTIGATFVDKTTDSTSVRAYGLDLMLNPGKNWKITGQLMGSSPGDFVDNFGGFVRVAHESNAHHVHIRYSDLGKTFKENINRTGFVKDDDRKELDVDFDYTFWLNNSWLRYVKLITANNAYWSQDGEFRTYMLRETMRVYLANKLSLDLYGVIENRLVDAKYLENSNENMRFSNHYLKSTLGYNTDESAFASLSYTFGENFGRTMSIWEGNTSVTLFKNLALNYSIVKLGFSPNQMDDLNLRLENSTLLNIVSLDYYFTNNLWIRVLAQSDSHRERLYFYGKFGWRFKPPFGALYLIYAGDDYYDHNDLMFMNSKTVFVKFTYPIGF